MIVLGLDPGPEESALILWNGVTILGHGNHKNCDLVVDLSHNRFEADFLAIEQIRGFGVMASNKLFDTCMFTGRFLQAFGEKRTFWVPRKEAAAHICGRGGISKDSFVREALIDRFGGKEKAVGNRKAPGPLFGVSGHAWAALCVAVFWWDNNAELRRGLFQ